MRAVLNQNFNQKKGEANMKNNDREFAAWYSVCRQALKLITAEWDKDFRMGKTGNARLLFPRTWNRVAVMNLNSNLEERRGEHEKRTIGN